MNIKNIVFDVGNVLSSFDSFKVLQTILPKSSFHQLYFDQFVLSPIWLELDRGTISINEAINLFIKQAEKKHPFCSKDIANIHSELSHFLNHFTDAMHLVDETNALFKFLKGKYPRYILSNFQLKPFERLCESAPHILEAEGLVVSAQVKMMKPNLDIYKYLLTTFTLNPRETLFIDDMVENIIAAQSLGIQGIVYRCAKQLFKDLHLLNIPLPKHVAQS